MDPEDMPETGDSKHHSGGSGHRGKRRGSAYVPFSKTAAGLDASFSKEKNREVWVRVRVRVRVRVGVGVGVWVRVGVRASFSKEKNREVRRDIGEI